MVCHKNILCSIYNIDLYSRLVKLEKAVGVLKLSLFGKGKVRYCECVKYRIQGTRVSKVWAFKILQKQTEPK